MLIEDLGLMPYRQAWAYQEKIHEEVVAGAPARLLLVEHPPVITLGRRAGIIKNLMASEAELEKLGVELVQSDRGGDITFHGPGQLVAYPIVRLLDHRFSVGGYVRRLEETVIRALKDLNLHARKDPDAIGIWIEEEGSLAKICALGVRIRRGVAMHGLALNVTTDLRYFNLIVPCGLMARPVTSLEKLLGSKAPSMQTVKKILSSRLQEAFQTSFSPA